MPKAVVHKQNRFSKHKKLIIITTGVLLAVLIIPGTALAYLGFVPGLTPLMGTNKPLDLGVTYSAEDFKSLQQKTLVNVSNFDQSHGLPQDITQVQPGSKLVLTGANTAMQSATQEELTALVNMFPWTASPLSNSQFRVADGTVEYSGNVKAAYVADVVKSAYPGANNPVLKLASYLNNPAIYLKARLSAVSASKGPSRAVLSFHILALRVNRFDLTSEVSKMLPLQVQVGEGSQSQGIPYSLSSLTASDGRVDFYGTLPTVLSVGNGEQSVVCENMHGSSLVTVEPTKGHIGSVTHYCD